MIVDIGKVRKILKRKKNAKQKKKKKVRCHFEQRKKLRTSSLLLDI